MNGSFALTWSPNPKWVYYKDPMMQLDHCMPYLRDFYKVCSICEVFPELTVQGNIHFHALFLVEDKVKWYRKILPTFRRNGMVVIKEVFDNKWGLYIRKDLELAQKIWKGVQLDGDGLRLKPSPLSKNHAKRLKIHISNCKVFDKLTLSQPHLGAESDEDP